MTDNSTKRQHPSDEINLRELFSILWRHKTFITLFALFFTVITVVVVYRMPKYYKTTTVIEVKPKKEDKSGGISLSSLGGAASLLGLSGLGGSASTTAKDAAKIAMYRTNKHVIDAVRYDTQYFVTRKFRPVEIGEDSCSISVSGLHIPDYKKFGMKVIFHPISNDKFELIAPSRIPFKSENLGTFTYDTPIHTKYFDCAIHHNISGATPESIVLNGDKHFVFDQIISKNLAATTGGQEEKTKVDLPFVTISYLDTLPKRGEQYVHKLLDTYIKQSIGDELEDINISLSSIDQQIRKIQAQASASSAQYEKYKSKNTILSPEAQAKVLIEQQALVEGKLSEIRHKLGMVNKLIQSAKNKKNIDTMAPALVQLGDEVSAGFIGKLQDLQIQETTLTQEFTAAYPKLKAVRRQIQNLRSKISKSLLSLRSIFLDERKMLKKEYAKYTRQLKQAPKLETGLAPLMRDYKLYETMYTYLLQKRSSLELKRAEALSRFRTIDPIYTNPHPAKPNKALITIVGLVASLLIAAFIIFSRELLKEEQSTIAPIKD